MKLIIQDCLRIKRLLILFTVKYGNQSQIICIPVIPFTFCRVIKISLQPVHFTCYSKYCSSYSVCSQSTSIKARISSVLLIPGWCYVIKEQNLLFTIYYFPIQFHTSLWRCSGLMVNVLDSEQALWIQALTGEIALCCWKRHFTLTVPLSLHSLIWHPSAFREKITRMHEWIYTWSFMEILDHD